MVVASSLINQHCRAELPDAPTLAPPCGEYTAMRDMSLEFKKNSQGPYLRQTYISSAS